MYQAIVFLPLLGFLVAGAIAIVGARMRHPGGYPVAGAEDHAHDAHGQVEAHRHGAPDPHADHAAVHVSHHEDHAAEPAAPGSRAAEVVTTALLFVSMALSWVAFVQVGFGGETE